MNDLKDILRSSAIQYARRVVIHVNKEEPNLEAQKQAPRRGTIKLSGLIHDRGNQSDPRLVWLTFQIICLTNSYTRKKETNNNVMILKSTTKNIQANEEIKKLKTHGASLKTLHIYKK